MTMACPGDRALVWDDGDKAWVPGTVRNAFCALAPNQAPNATTVVVLDNGGIGVCELEHLVFCGALVKYKASEGHAVSAVTRVDVACVRVLARDLSGGRYELRVKLEDLIGVER